MPSLAEFHCPHHPFPMISGDGDTQEFYVLSRRNGTAHRMAEMFAFQRSPALKTATRWIGGHERTITDDMPEIVRHRMEASAKAAGVTCDGAVYKSSLARFPGDPEAWVSSVEDCKRVADKRGMKLEGGIEHTPPGYNAEPISDVKAPYKVADDIVNEKFETLCEEQPDEKRRPGAKAELADALAGKE